MKSDLHFKIFHDPRQRIMTWLPLQYEIIEDQFPQHTDEMDELIFHGLSLDFTEHIRQEVGTKILKTKIRYAHV